MEKRFVGNKYLDELAPSRDVINLYKNKLEKCIKDYETLFKYVETLNLEMEDRGRLEEKLGESEQKLGLVNDMLSRTQALLLIERSNSQQMALHIDILRKQHEMDREKLDLILSLNGKPVHPSLFQSEMMLKQQIDKMDKLMKEQNSKLMEERSLMKAEWDKERRVSEKCQKNLRLKIQKLQEQLVIAKEQQILYNQRKIENFLNGKSVPEDEYLNICAENWCTKDQKSDMAHCSTQEMKKLKRKVDELEKQIESYQRKCVAQASTLKEIKDDFQIKQEKFQAYTKGCLEQVERLREENDRLNKRRLTEGSGFRAEIKILKEQLQRTQKQLCFLTLRKLED